MPVTPLYRKIMEKARKTIKQMDKLDGRSVADHPIYMALRTVMQAIETAINLKDWNVVGEAQAMLEQIEFRRRPADSKRPEQRS